MIKTLKGLSLNSSMKKITITVVSGTPGTGKTTLAKRLAKKNHARYLNVNKVIRERKLDKQFSKKWKSQLIDIDKLNKSLISIIKEHQKKKQSLVIDSHLAHYIPHKYVDLCVITKCSLKKLLRRLKKRKYSKKKIRENMDAEILDVCLLEAILNKQKVKVVKT